MTAPNPIAEPGPILISLTNSFVRVKWYTGRCGAFKFAVQLRGQNEYGEWSEDDWNIVYNGQETVYTHTSLASDKDYQIRVLAVNYAGTMSTPSKNLQVFKKQSPQNMNI